MKTIDQLFATICNYMRNFYNGKCYKSVRVYYLSVIDETTFNGKLRMSSIWIGPKIWKFSDLGMFFGLNDNTVFSAENQQDVSELKVFDSSRTENAVIFGKVCVLLVILGHIPGWILKKKLHFLGNTIARNPNPVLKFENCWKKICVGKIPGSSMGKMSGYYFVRNVELK